MSDTIFRREVVAANLAIDPRVLVRYEELGFIRSVRIGEAVGYPPAEVRRIWSIVSFQHDLGVNLAGVEVILKLRDRMDALHRQVVGLAGDLRAALDDPAGGDGDDA